MSLKELTAESHKLAETQPFVKLLFSGNISIDDYSKYLFNQFLIYSVLEKYASDAGVFDDLPGISRSANITADLKELWKTDTFINAPSVPATRLYLEYLETIKTDPTKLLAHVYVRHMGDLSGGQMIAKKVPGDGKFYKFDNPDELKAAIRAKVTDELADEANKCFNFAVNLFEDLMK